MAPAFYRSGSSCISGLVGKCNTKEVIYIELLAIWRRFQFTLELDILELQVYTDYKETLRLIASNGNTYHKFLSFIWSIKDLLATNSTFYICHTLRERNDIANWVPKQGSTVIFKDQLILVHPFQEIALFIFFNCARTNFIKY